MKFSHLTCSSCNKKSYLCFIQHFLIIIIIIIIIRLNYYFDPFICHEISFWSSSFSLSQFGPYFLKNDSIWSSPLTLTKQYSRVFHLFFFFFWWLVLCMLLIDTHRSIVPTRTLTFKSVVLRHSLYALKLNLRLVVLNPGHKILFYKPSVTNGGF